MVLAAGNAALCAEWIATPEARMACCEGGDCPMHKGRSDDSGADQVVTQAQAYACCAASGSGQPNSSSPMSVATISAAVLGVGAIVPTITPSLMLTDGWRTRAPIHRPSVARHILLSVFLV
jgi:hypothetical protein